MDNNVFDAFGAGFFEKFAADGDAAPAAEAKPGLMDRIRGGAAKAKDYVLANKGKSLAAAALLGGAIYGGKKLLDRRKKEKEEVKEAAFNYFYEKLAEPFGERMKRYGGAIGSHLSAHKGKYLAGAGAVGAGLLARHLYKKRKAKKQG